MKTERNTAFTVELLGLFILLIMVITVISSVFVMSRAHSLQARELTEAVILAENAAEVSSTAADNETLLDRLTNDFDNNGRHLAAASESSEDSGITVITAATLKKTDTQDPDKLYIVRVTRSYPEGRDYAEDIIDVYAPGTADASDLGRTDPAKFGEPLYTLKSGTHLEAQTGKGEGGTP